MDYLNDIAKSLVSKETIISLLIVDLNYNVLMCNDKLNKTIGYTNIKKGDSFYMLLDFYGEKVKEGIKKSFDGELSEIEHKNIKDDRFFNTLIQPLRDKNNTIYGAYIISKDITKRINQLNFLEHNERELRLLYDNAPLGYQSLDENGRFLYVNDALAHMLEYSKEELIGKWFGNFLCPTGSITFNKNFSEFKKRGKTKVNIEMLTKSGNPITIRFDGKIAYKDDGSFKQTHCILKDVTEKEKMKK
jgi:PAS domain S-box-containing protein